MLANSFNNVNILGYFLSTKWRNDDYFDSLSLGYNIFSFLSSLIFLLTESILDLKLLLIWFYDPSTEKIFSFLVKDLELILSLFILSIDILKLSRSSKSLILGNS